MILLNTKKNDLFTKKIVEMTNIDNDIYKPSYELQGGLRPKQQLKKKRMSEKRKK